jgi:hypothetical protein
MRDARAVLRARMERNGWSLRDVAGRTRPLITQQAVKLYLDGRPPGWKVATAVGNLLGWTPERVLKSAAVFDGSDGESGRAGPA